MKKAFVLLIIIAAFTITGCSQGVDLEAEKAAALRVMELTVEAEKSFNADEAVKYFSDDVIILPQDMPQIQGKQALHDMYTEFFKILASFDSKSTETFISQSGDMVTDIGWNKFVFKSPEGNFEVMGKYLAVMKKVNGEWKIAAIAINNDQPAK